LSYLGHALAENRNGLIAAAMVTHGDGYAERDAALLMLAEKQKGRARRITRLLSFFVVAATTLVTGTVAIMTHNWSNRSSESAPAATPAPAAAAGPKDVYIDPTKYPAAAGHAADAQAAGHPEVLTVDRGGAADRRAQATAGQATEAGKDRDEYPPAVTAAGGKVANRKTIPSSDNRGAGASVLGSR
jgi:hypothetical protein